MNAVLDRTLFLSLDRKIDQDQQRAIESLLERFEIPKEGTKEYEYFVYFG